MSTVIEAVTTKLALSTAVEAFGRERKPFTPAHVHVSHGRLAEAVLPLIESGTGVPPDPFQKKVGCESVPAGIATVTDSVAE